MSGCVGRAADADSVDQCTEPPGRVRDRATLGSGLRPESSRTSRSASASSLVFVRTSVGSGSSSGSCSSVRRLLDEQRRLEAERLGHVLDLRQIAQVVQPEANQEFLGRRVQERPADDLLAADDLDRDAARAAC